MDQGFDSDAYQCSVESVGQSCIAVQEAWFVSTHMLVYKAEHQDKHDKACLEEWPRWGDQAGHWQDVACDGLRPHLCHRCRAEHIWGVHPQEEVRSLLDEKVGLEEQKCRGHHHLD